MANNLNYFKYLVGFVHQLGFQLIKPMKCGIQKQKNSAGNHHLGYFSVCAEKNELGSHQINRNVVLSKQYVNLQNLAGNPFSLSTVLMRCGLA